MINFLILLFFFIYSASIFFIKNIYILGLIFIFNFIISLILKVKFIKHLKIIRNNLIFILFIVICNLIFSDIYTSLLVGVRLFLVIDYTYLMGCYFDSTKIRIAFKYFFYPLKIFKVNIDDLTLIVAIALAFIPILADEAKMIKLALKSKGFKFNLITLITKPHIYLITFFNNLFDRVDELEKSLSTKGY